MASYITAFVVKKNGNPFINSDGSVGNIMEVPTPENGGVIDGDVWLTPVNQDILSDFLELPYNLNNSLENVAPTLYSVAGVLISSSKSSDSYVLLGTSAQYIAGTLPTVWGSLIHTKQKIPVCQTLGSTNPVSGLYEITLGVPSQLTGKLYAFGYFNGVALTALSTGGYNDAPELVIAMNSNWGATVGGTFTATVDGLTVILTQTAGTGTAVFCGQILEINESA